MYVGGSGGRLTIMDDVDTRKLLFRALHETLEVYVTPAVRLQLLRDALSVSGLGVREGTLVILLAPLGVSSGQAVAFGLLLYGMNMVVSLLGAPAFAVGPRPARVAA